MARKNGYVVKISAFVETSKTDFTKQAETAAFMAALTKGTTLPAEFNDRAVITDISAKYGSADIATNEGE